MKRRILALLGLLISVSPAATPTEWLTYPTPGLPRTPDGKPEPDRSSAGPPMASRISPVTGV